MFRPSAIASSLPLNHFETIADYATDSDSPPRPKMTLPAIMTPNDFWYPPIINTPCPNVRIPEKTSIPSLRPIRSKKIPPKMGSTVFG